MTADSVNIPPIQISIPSLRGNHFSCCKPSAALPSVSIQPRYLHLLLKWFLKSSLIDLVAEEQRVGNSRRHCSSHRNSITCRHWSYPVSLTCFGMWEAACAWRSISKGQDSIEGVVLSLDFGPKIHWSSKLSFPSWSRLGEMLTTATAEEQWKGPSLLALQHLGRRSVWYLHQDFEWRTPYLPLGQMTNGSALFPISSMGFWHCFGQEKGLGVIFLRGFFPVGCDKSRALLLSVLTHKNSSSIWRKSVSYEWAKIFQTILGKVRNRLTFYSPKPDGFALKLSEINSVLGL